MHGTSRLMADEQKPLKIEVGLVLTRIGAAPGSITEADFQIPPALRELSVDADIEKFDKYFQEELKNDPLIPSEKAMLKTYLWFKLHGEKGADSSTAEPV